MPIRPNRILWILCLWSAVFFSTNQAMAGALQVNELGVAISGFDPVSYHNPSGPLEGSPDHRRQHRGATYYFANAENASVFDGDPNAYVPSYGGNCALGVAMGMFSPVDPLAYSIRDGRLFLMINPATQNMWLKKEEKLITKADKAWQRLVPQPNE